MVNVFSQLQDLIRRRERIVEVMLKEVLDRVISLDGGMNGGGVIDPGPEDVQPPAVATRDLEE